MTKDEAEKLTSILIARQVPEANAAGFGWQWSVDIETGRVLLDKGETLTPDLFLGVTVPTQWKWPVDPPPSLVAESTYRPENAAISVADGPSFVDTLHKPEAAGLTHFALQSTADHICQMAAARRAEIVAMDKLWAKQSAADYTARIAEIEAAMKAQTLKFRTQWIAGRTPTDDDGA